MVSLTTFSEFLLRLPNDDHDNGDDDNNDDDGDGINDELVHIPAPPGVNMGKRAITVPTDLHIVL